MFKKSRRVYGIPQVAENDGVTRYGMFITPAGLAAIGVDEGEGQGSATAAVPAPAGTKAAQMLALLSRIEGATLFELIVATGWLPRPEVARAITGTLVGTGVLWAQEEGVGMSVTIRCAIYTRKSSVEGLEQDFNSLNAQREACSAYIHSQASQGWCEMAERRNACVRVT